MRIEGWEIERELAEGGTATVHAARGPSGDVVIKVLKRALADDRAWLARFDREQRAFRGVKHANVVPVLDSGRTDDGLPYLVMPRIDRTLRHVIEEGARSPAEAWRIARAIAGALSAAHELGIVHRDVKPDNVLMDGDVPKLADFGLAKDIDGDAVKVTSTGAPVGTPAYMAPEQWWGHGVGPAVDQYALGILLFELVSGHTPFASADGYAAVMQAHVSETPPSLPNASESQRAFVVKLLAKKPEERFASIDAAIRAGDEAFGLPHEHTGPARGHWAWAIASFAVLLVLGYGGLHDPRDWIHIVGWGGWTIAIAFVVIAIALWRKPHLVPLALIPGIQGTVATYTGWMATLGGVTTAATAQRLSVYEEGLFEANMGRFAGGVISAGLLLQALGGLRGRARPHEIGALVIRLVALALASTAALTWVDAQSAHAFTAATRAARAAEIIRWDHAKTWVGIGIAVAVAIAGVHGWVRIRRAPRATTLIGRPILLLAACWACLAALDASFLSRMRETRQALWVQLAPEFELDAQLVPPAMEGLPEPPVAPTIAISNGRVSVDAEPVGLVDALGTPTGARVLAADLSHAIGKQKDARILVAVDRRVPFGQVRDALLVARDLGVRTIVFLFTRGPAPVLAPGDPPEAAYALPKDFGGLEVELAPDGATIAADATFETAASSLRVNRRLAL
jgi:tRNA A-37 threonylcarbamoyl transferase component Bud32